MTRFLTATAVSALLSAPALAQSVFVLDEIIFTATAQPLRFDRIGSSVDVIEGEDLDSLGEVQLSDALTRLPGLNVVESGPPGTAAQLRIRGAGAENIAVFVDGILVNDPTATEQSFDNFGGLTTGSVRRIEILRGSQSALYGGTAIAGVINITTVGGDDTPMGLSQSIEVQGGSYATFSTDYAMTYRTSDTILSFGLSSVVSDGFSAAEEDTGNTEADPYDQTRLSFGIEREVSDTLTVGLNGFYETGSVEFDEYADTPIDGTPGDEGQDRDAFGLRTYLEAQTGIWTHSAALAYYRIERHAFSLTISPETALAFGSTFDNLFEGERVTLDYLASAQLRPDLALSFGADLRDETATYPNTLGGTSSVQTYGVFAEATWSPNDLFDLTGTLRHDDHTTFGGETTGRLAFAWRPTDSTLVRGAIGTGYRPPSLDELYGSYPAVFFTGNPNLMPETSTSYEIGVDHSFANGAQIGATLFYLEIENLIVYDPVPAPNSLINVPGISERSGIEIAAAFPLSDRITLSGAYTYTDAYAATGARLSAIPRHDLVLGLDAEISDRARLSLTAQHVADRANGTFDPTPYEDYTVVDTTFTYGLTDEVEAFLRVENLFDEAYQTQSGYGTSDRAVYVGLRAAF